MKSLSPRLSPHPRGPRQGRWPSQLDLGAVCLARIRHRSPENLADQSTVSSKARTSSTSNYPNPHIASRAGPGHHHPNSHPPAKLGWGKGQPGCSALSGLFLRPTYAQLLATPVRKISPTMAPLAVVLLG